MAVDPLWDNVVLRLTLDEVLTDYSDSAHTVQMVQGSIPGTPSGDPIWQDGRFGKSAQLGGINNTANRLEITGSLSDFNFGAGDFTVEWWLYGVSSTGRLLISADNFTTGQRAFNFGLSTRVTSGGNVNRYSIEAQLWSAANAVLVDITSGLEFGPTGNGYDEWTHLCFEREGGNFRVYRNGVMIHKVTTLGTTAVHDATTPLMIGGRPTFSGGGRTAGVHWFDDIRITKGVARFASDLGFTPPSSAYPTSGDVEPTEVEVDAGALVVTGAAPLVIGQEVAEPSPGALVITGGQPAVVQTGEAYPLTGSLVITGQAPEIFNGIYALPSPGHLVVAAGAPEVLIFTEASALVSQTAVLAIAEPPPPPARISQQAVLGIGYVIPEVAVSQQAILVIAHGGPCVTSRCQIWTITRRDGRVFRYTSHDEDVQFGLETYKACHSLNPSASENASSLGSVGNIELVGIIDDDGISEADLYGGRFDDAYVTVDLIAWGSPVEAPRRLASGWTGQLSQGDTSFNMEVLGSSSRLEQQALTQPYAPGCRWIFGDSRCGVDVEAKKLAGQITSVASRARFGAELSGGPGAWQWANGRVRFLTGPNAGQVLEVKTVDFDTGLITLWPSAAMLPTAGDEFELLPGCDLAKDGGCSVYANVINFGGFPDVPGEDAMLETPNAQY